VASGKFTEAKIDEFIDYFNRLWMKLEETGYADFQRCFARPTSIEPLTAVSV
jgi:hypothetical protein